MIMSYKGALCLCTAIPFFATATHAQTVDTSETQSETVEQTSAAELAGSNTIIVTARRRDERLQDVPMAITALGAEEIERKAVSGLEDMRRVSPSLNVSQSAGGGRQMPLFTIRGQRQGDTLASVDPSVGVYIGDQLFKRTYGLNQVVFDMGSIEVLKGPQGTLFGLNTTGGNIVFRPNLPTYELEASVKASFGNYDYRAFEGFVNVPLSDTLAIRIAGQYQKRDGYITSVVTGEDAQDLDGGGVRASLRFEPNDRLETIFTGSYMQSSTNGTGWRLNLLQEFSGLLGTGQSAGITDVTCNGANPNSCTPTSVFGNTGYDHAVLYDELEASNKLGFYETRQQRDNFAKTDPAWNIANTTTYNLSDTITLKNIVGYRAYTASYSDEVDGSALSILEYGAIQDGKEFSEEFQVLGDMGNLNWIIGAYYFQEEVDSASLTTKLISPKLDGLKPPYTGIENVKNTSKSIFASGTQKLDFIDYGLSLTLGGRYTWDKREAEFGIIDRLGYAPGDTTGLGTPSAGEGCSFNPATDPDILLPEYNYDPNTCLVNLNEKFDQFTYTATLDWKVTSDLLLYVAHRKGYRAGGLSTRAASSAQLVSFKPEEVKDYEIGAKLNLNLGSGIFLQTNVAAYKQDYKDIQRLVPLLIEGGAISTNIVNAASAKIKGFEVETTFAVADWLELGGFVSHVDPSYDSFMVASAKPGVGNIDVANVAPFSGVPRWQYGLSGRVTQDASFGEVSLSLNYYHQSAFRIQDQVGKFAGSETPTYGLLNGRIQVADIADSGFTAAFFVNNLTNERHLIGNYSLSSGFGFASSLAGPPRMYGLELRYNFGE